MAAVVAVHGVGKQTLGEDSLLKDWYPALCDGMRRAGGAAPTREAVAMGFYGDLFRPSGSTLAIGDPRYTAEDVQEGLEEDLLLSWWQAAAAVDERVVDPEANTLTRTPRSVQAALRALGSCGFFADLALRALVFDLKQVSHYLTDEALRQAAIDRVTARIEPDTRVVVGHSLGSVVAYQALCALPGHRVRALVTLGSPLGVPMVYRRMRPEPGGWPGDGELVWTNVVDHGDVVALEKDLRPRYGPRVRLAVVANGSHAHDACPYLTARPTGAAVLEGLNDGS